MNEQKPLAWMDEAFKHLGIKEIKGPKTHPEIAKMLVEVKAGWKSDDTIPWCFTGDTEVLTEKGWQRFDCLDADRVYQVDSSGKMSLTNYQTVVKYYSGRGFNFKAQGTDLICDPEHRFVGHKYGTTKEQEFFTLDKLTDSESTWMTNYAPYADDVDYPISDEELHFIAAFIADGKYRYSKTNNSDGTRNIYRIEFEVSVRRKIKSLTSLNPTHVYTQTRTYGFLTQVPLTIFSFKLPEKFLDYFKDYKVLSDELINGLSKRQAEYFIKCYKQYDGAWNKELIYCSNPDNINQLSTLILKSGRRPVIRKRKDYGLGMYPGYIINFGRKNGVLVMKGKHVTETYLDTMLYCVTVPNSRIIVKRGISTPMVVGNCGVFAGAVLKRSGRAYPVKAPGWALSYRNNGVILEKPAYGAIFTKKRNGGGHVGFVAGITETGMIVGLGGNQSDSVNLALFKPSDLTFTWPALANGTRTVPTAERYNLPVYDSKTLTLSVKED